MPGDATATAPIFCFDRSGSWGGRSIQPDSMTTSTYIRNNVLLHRVGCRVHGGRRYTRTIAGAGAATVTIRAAPPLGLFKLNRQRNNIHPAAAETRTLRPATLVLTPENAWIKDPTQAAAS